MANATPGDWRVQHDAAERDLLDQFVMDPQGKYSNGGRHLANTVQQPGMPPPHTIHPNTGSIHIGGSSSDGGSNDSLQRVGGGRGDVVDVRTSGFAGSSMSNTAPHHNSHGNFSAVGYGGVNDRGNTMTHTFQGMRGQQPQQQQQTQQRRPQGMFSDAMQQQHSQHGSLYHGGGQSNFSGQNTLVSSQSHNSHLRHYGNGGMLDMGQLGENSHSEPSGLSYLDGVHSGLTDQPISEDSDPNDFGLGLDSLNGTVHHGSPLSNGLGVNIGSGGVNPLGIGIKRDYGSSSEPNDSSGFKSKGQQNFSDSMTTRSRGSRMSSRSTDKGKSDNEFTGSSSSSDMSSSSSSLSSTNASSSSSSTTHLNPAVLTTPLMTRDQLREAAAKEVAEQREAEMAKNEAEQEKKGGNKRKLMSSEEKAKANRDRNREHARNTRLRKKAYVAKLTQLVTDLSTQTEAQARERALTLTREREQATVRRNVLHTLAEYRSAGMTDRFKWATILDEKFVCKIPVTPYRSFKQCDIIHNSRVIRGIDDFIADVKSLHICIESIGAPSNGWKEARARGEKVRATYALQDEDMIISGNVLMSRYCFATENATRCGAECECTLYGMLRVTYTEQNKLSSCEFMFDVMSFMQLLQHASCPDAEMPIVPNTVAMAQTQSKEARVITANQPGNPIVHVNGAWTKLCGFTQEESEGKSLSILQGPGTDGETVGKLMEDINQGHPTSMTVTNYNKEGNSFTVRYFLTCLLTTRNR